MNGRFFKSYVKPGDIVIPGDLIAEADINAIKQAGYDPTIMIIDTSHTEHRQSIILQKDHVTAKNLSFALNLFKKEYRYVTSNIYTSDRR